MANKIMKTLTVGSNTYEIMDEYSRNTIINLIERIVALEKITFCDASSNSTFVEVINENGVDALTTAYGNSAILRFKFSSTKNGVSTGYGTCQITVNDTLCTAINIQQGSNYVDIAEYLEVGTNNVKVKCIDAYSNHKTLTYTISVVDSIMYVDLVHRNLSGEYINDTVTDIGTYAFEGCVSLTSVNFPSAINIKNSAFSYCTVLTDAHFPKVINIGNTAFSDCSNLINIDLPEAAFIGYAAFNRCSNLDRIDLPKATSIADRAFYSCSNLHTLILRNEEGICDLAGASVFVDTPIASGTGFIYVPSSLINTYKSATNWSTYANRFRTIEDYPYICDPYTWNAVLTAVDEGVYKKYYSVGDTIPIDFGSEGIVNMQIAGFDHDSLSDSAEKSHISFISKELLSTNKAMNYAAKSDGSGNSSYNAGGWAYSDMRTYCNNTILGLIPESVQSAIKKVSKVSDGGYYNKTLVTTYDKIWIPSYAEVGFSNSSYAVSGQGSAYELFANGASKVKQTIDSAIDSAWWLRSAYTNNANIFWNVGNNGNVATSHATNIYGIAIGFCI